MPVTLLLCGVLTSQHGTVSVVKHWYVITVKEKTETKIKESAQTEPGQ